MWNFMSARQLTTHNSTVVCRFFLLQGWILRYPDKLNYFHPCHKCGRHVIGYVEPIADDTQDVEGRRLRRVRNEVQTGGRWKKEGERGGEVERREHTSGNNRMSAVWHAHASAIKEQHVLKPCAFEHVHKPVYITWKHLHASLKPKHLKLSLKYSTLPLDARPALHYLSQLIPLHTAV